MQINETRDGDTLSYALAGRLDTATAPELEVAFKRAVDSSVKHLLLDFAALDYISSSGLRVLLAAQKVMNRQGDMVVRNVNESIMEVFDITGFSELLTIE